MPRALLAALVAVLAIPAAADAATVRTDRQCYTEGAPMGIGGMGWTPGSQWSVSTDQIFASGTADDTGEFFTGEERAPLISTAGIKPKAFTLTATEDGEQVARTTFRVVNFLVDPKSENGNPAGRTAWLFSGFIPGKPIYVHVKRGRKLWHEKAGRGDRRCGTLKTRMRRLPAVPPSRIGFGKYRVYVDNRRKFSVGGLQYRATITIYRT
jgi:hypothetical protein